MDSKIIIPRFDYMCQNNTFTGSVGDFRYKIYPKEIDETETVFIAAAYRTNCYDVELLAGRVEEKEFEYSNDGIDEAKKWLSGFVG